jgi:hypothetical protein
VALRDIYDELVAVADLRDDHQYVTTYIPADGHDFADALVCAIGIAPLRVRGEVGASLFIEFDADGNVIQDWLDDPPEEAMAGWDGVTWERIESLDRLPAYINPDAHGLSSEFSAALRERRGPP